MKRVAVIIREPDQHHEGLRAAVGLLQGQFHVQVFVLQHEIIAADEALRKDMALLDQMDGERYSDIPANVTQYGFKHASLAEVADKIRSADVIIPL